MHREGRKDYDWSHLAARYFPTRVDHKCQEDPSLAVAHGCFWRDHPATAYRWELRLQDEIAPTFTVDEPDSDPARESFLRDHPTDAAELRAKETKRRERKAKKDEQRNLYDNDDDEQTDAAPGEPLRQALARLADPTFWDDPALHAAILARLPNYRLSKFQQALPEDAAAEAVGRYLVSRRGARRYVGKALGDP